MDRNERTSHDLSTPEHGGSVDAATSLVTHAVADHPYASFIHRIEKPVRYLGGEHGAAHKPWASVKARVALAFPDLYDIGMSHLGFKILYGILNGHPSTLAERAYAPWSDMEHELRTRGLPLVSLESARPLRDFDVVGFSLQYELTFTNVLLMLELGGVPLRSAQRGDEHPLVLAGGPTATHPEPVAPFFDAILVGDGERACVEIALAWAAFREAKMPREERLRQLARIPGVYVPSLYETEYDEKSCREVVSRPRVPEAPARVERAFVGDLNQYPFPSGGPVAATETVFDRISVEIARGCTEGCRFCQAGMIYRPVRERDPQQIVDTIVRAVKSGGYDEASLTCLSTADYSCIAPLVKKVSEALEGEKVALSVSSLRAYGLSEPLLDELQKVRASGLTFAPEAGTQRMRDVVNKNVTEEQLMETAERVFSRGWSKMKLYFMIGLPTEEDDDVRGIVETGRKARDVGRRVQKGKPPTVTVSVSTHVPKPHTPFQWCALDSLDEIRRKQGLLRDGARAARVDLRMHESQGSTLEGLLARGDRRLADVIEDAYLHGARFDAWEERLHWKAWSDALAKYTVDVPAYLRTIPVDARLPWDHIDVGLEDGFLLREYRKALASRLSPPCGKAAGMFVHHTNLAEAKGDARKLICYDCGVACDLTQMRTERFAMLESLGALEPPVRVVHQLPIAPEERRPRAKFTQGEPRRYRMSFRRIGRAAFQSHLDLIRVLPRVFRRAEIEMYYSQGFHPKPDMVFTPALALGVATLDEYVDVKLAESIETEGLAARLQPGAPEGLLFGAIVPLHEQDPSVAKVIERTEYVAAIPWGALRERGFDSVERIGAHLAARLALRENAGLTAKRPVEGGLARSIDVGAYLLDARAGEGYESLDEAGFGGELFALRFATRVTPSGTCKPSEVVTALFDAEIPVRFVRVAQGFVDHLNGDVMLYPMQTEEIRAAWLARAAVARAERHAARAAAELAQASLAEPEGHVGEPATSPGAIEPGANEREAQPPRVSA